MVLVSFCKYMLASIKESKFTFVFYKYMFASMKEKEFIFVLIIIANFEVNFFY